MVEKSISWFNISGNLISCKSLHGQYWCWFTLCYRKSLKSFLAFQNKKISKTHDLPELYELVNDFIELEEDEVLYVANKYHVEMSYPHFDRQLPSRNEIKVVLEFTQELFIKVCKKLDITQENIIDTN